MEKLLLILLVTGSASPSLAFCSGPGYDVVGRFEVVHSEPALIGCTGDGGSKKLKLPGCVITFKKIKTKTNEASEIRSYVNPELCSLKQGDSRELRILSACCDVFLQVSCDVSNNGLFDPQKSDRSIACNAGTSRYVFAYKSKEGVIRELDGETRSFRDTQKKVLEAREVEPSPKNQKPNWLFQSFGEKKLSPLKNTNEKKQKP